MAKQYAAKAIPPKKKIVYVGGIDRPFLAAVLLLLALGTVMVFSASYPSAYATQGGDSYYFARRQLLYAVLGLVAMGAVIFIPQFDYHVIRRFAVPLYIVSFLLLVGVLLFGIELNEAKRWYSVGGITFQPSEIAKFALVVILAEYADKCGDKIRTGDSVKDILKNMMPLAAAAVVAGVMLALGMSEKIEKVPAFIIAGAMGLFIVVRMAAIIIRRRLPSFSFGVVPFVLLLGLPAVTLYFQPHISCILIMAGITFIMMYLSGTKLLYMGGGTVLGLIGAYVLAKSQVHSSGRLEVWMDPFSYLEKGGWQPVQSLYAIGSGGIWGVGFGNSRQKFSYLPEPQNDYVFAIWCEEMGFVGAILVMAVFLFFICRGIHIGLHAPDRFSSLLVIGIVSHVALQAILNIAVVTNSVPSTGISLPFFSYGGTSLVILLAEMGVVLSVSRYASVKKSV